MKTVVLRSLLIAALFAPVVSFFAIVPASISKMVPPVGAHEFDDLPLSEVKARIAERTVKLSGWQWAAERCTERWFWADLLKRSVVPFAAVFAGGIWMAAWEQRERARRERDR